MNPQVKTGKDYFATPCKREREDNNHHDGLAEPRTIYNLLDQNRMVGIDGYAEEFIKHAFYLPREVLQNANWKIEPIVVMDNVAWRTFFTASQRHPDVSLVLDPNSVRLLLIANQVGVSIRTHVTTGKQYVVAKLWYGRDSYGKFTANYKDGKVRAYVAI